MDDEVRRRASELQAKWDAEEVARSKEAARTEVMLAEIASAVKAALKLRTSVSVELDHGFDEFEPDSGWINISARLVRPNQIDVRPMITIRVNTFEGEVSYTIEDQAADSAYFGGAAFASAEPTSKEATIALAADTAVETLAHLMASGKKLDESL